MVNFFEKKLWHMVAFYGFWVELGGFPLSVKRCNDQMVGDNHCIWYDVFWWFCSSLVIINIFGSKCLFCFMRLNFV